MAKNTKTEEQPEVKPAPQFLDHIGEVVSRTNELHKLFVKHGPVLRGAHKKFLAEHALKLLSERLVSLHNIALWSLNEENEEPKSEPSPEPMVPPVTVPEKLVRKDIDPTSVRALRICVRAINRVMDSISDATQYYIKMGPYMSRSAQSAVSRAIVEMIRVTKIEQDRLVPPATPEAQAESIATLEAIEFYLIENMKRHDERQYLSIAQRAIYS